MGTVQELFVKGADPELLRLLLEEEIIEANSIVQDKMRDLEKAERERDNLAWMLDTITAGSHATQRALEYFKGKEQ